MSREGNRTASMSAYYASFLLGLLVYFLPSNVCVVAIAELYGAEEAELHLNEDPEPGSCECRTLRR